MVKPLSPPLTVIIGHRGTGKSHWLELVKGLYARHKKRALFFDLDEEVKALSGQSIEALLYAKTFRKWEARAFAHIIKIRSPQLPAFVACGAGFKFKKTAALHVIHLRRPSDSAGRILPSRPRLTRAKSPFKESQRLFRLREPYYKGLADEAFSRREHFKEAGREDRLFLGLARSRRKLFSLTLREDLKASLEGFLKKRAGWPMRFFELNDQTSSLAFARKAQRLVPPEKLLFSSQKGASWGRLKGKRHWSWDVSLGQPPPGATALSLHNRGGKSFQALLSDFSQKGFHLKLAVEVRSLEELWQGFCWWREDPSRRSFLPRSQNGRWAWFREAFGPEAFFYFIREGGDGVLDQPLFAAACQRIQKASRFAAVAGSPVESSASPFEQGPFFKALGGIPFFAMPLKRGEMTRANLEILKSMGFVFLAITSPLKKEAFQAVEKGARGWGRKLKSLNTLILHKGEWRGFNTDIQGFKLLQKRAAGRKTAVFGGDGVRPALRELLPDALFYSARKRQALFGKKAFKPEVLIHAVPRLTAREQTKQGRQERQAQQGPPASWRPRLVLDLSYGENSPGLEYALSIGAVYKSGWEVFKAQAKAQRALFQKLAGL